MIPIGLSQHKEIGFNLDRLIETRLLIQSSSGGGKSYALRKILEETSGKVQQIVIDPEGEFSTLRENYDFIIAGQNADTPVQTSSAKLLARKVMELRASIICDLSDLKAHDRVKFVRLFLESLMQTPKSLWHPVLVIIDEAHLFCPEKGQAESAPAVIDLATRGRKRGFCAVLATQRLSKLHKDACAELLNKMIGRTSLDIDQKRAADELGFIKKESRLDLRKLLPGEFHVYGPALANIEGEIVEVTKLKVDKVKSKHPEVGSKYKTVPPEPTGKIKKVLSELADLPEEAIKEIHDLDYLKRENIKLKRELTLSRKEQPPVKSCNYDQLIKNMKADINHQEAKIKRACDRLILIAGQELTTVVSKLNKVQEDLGKALLDSHKKILKIPQQNHSANNKPVNESSDYKIKSAHQKIINTLHSLELMGVDAPKRSNVAVLSGVSSTSGGYGNNLSELRTLGLIDYPSGGCLSLTDAGRKLVSVLDGIIENLDDLHEAWYKKISSSQQKILRFLIDNYPNEYSRADVAEALEVSITSGGYGNNLSGLRTLGTIDYPKPGFVVATKLLFPEGLSA